MTRLGVFTALAAVALAQGATNGPAPEPDMTPRDPDISPRAKRNAERMRREVHETTRSKSADDDRRLADADAKRQRKAQRRLNAAARL